MDTSDDNAVGAAETADENASTTAGAAAIPAGDNDDTQNSAKTGNRRRSTRVIKKPALPYSSEPSPPKPSRGKRKRPLEEEEEEEQEREDGGEKGSGGENEEDESANDESEDDGDEGGRTESSEEDEDEGEPDEEEKKDRRRRNAAARGAGERGGSAPFKKPPTKKPRTSVITSTAPPARKTTTEQAKRVKGKAVAKPPPKAANGDDDNEEEEGNRRIMISTAWTIKYEENSREAMKELVNFILKCCGCHKFVTDYDIEDQDTANTTLSQIQEAFQQPEFRRFRPILASFLHSLITIFAARELLYSDPGLMEGIEVWITAMSSSTLRQFRHTSTIVALEFVSCLAQIAAEVRKANSTTNRQLEAEKKKSSRNEGRIRALDQKLKDGEERREGIETVIKDIFNIVFAHRYRDIDAKIRSDCVRELGSWILTLPDLFFDGSYLRYLGWVLSDTTLQTRLEAVKALTKLFKKKELISKLRHFTERFRPRMVEMTARDADTNVRAAAADLLDAVREAGYLEPSNYTTHLRSPFSTSCIFSQTSPQKVSRAVKLFTDNQCKFAIRGGGSFCRSRAANTNDGILIVIEGPNKDTLTNEDSVWLSAGLAWSDVYGYPGPYYKSVVAGCYYPVGTGLLFGAGLSFGSERPMD
ncbi:STAG domain-domain-containing protein [Tuber borchii]|uniref:STAG domain-domain-containing protein n=1 Tax=Tuber borchii TaxID=42251 RepID=A0A2T6ZQA4_TUBBO|nr:STAG domain-domain-containing protein [Tuber borchii]